MEISFNVQGDLITKTARDWFYLERRPFKEVKKLLLSCMCGTDIPKEILDQYVEEILKFKKKLKGETKDGSFCLTDETETKKLEEYYKDFRHYELIKKCGKIPFEICEYGFINPQGEYIPVEWCKHSEWAKNYLEETMEKEKRFNLLNRFNCSSTDILIEGLNWILIDNPNQGKGIIQQGKRVTKAQKETLYDYLMFFNRKNEAVKLYQSDEEEEEEL